METNNNASEERVFFMMNNMWKKTLAGITIMAMLLSGAAGCGEQKSVSTTPVAETSAEETQEETSAE
ncbi:MAG TPA: hypothetical protein DCZ62_06105, partial [Ruminococcus sp.]|nr:hypothetical protein [Ruminococcus sp.]